MAGTSLGSEAVLTAAGNVMRALESVHDDAGLFVTLGEANSLGMAMMSDRDVDDAFEAITSNRADTLVVMQNDLYERAQAGKVDAAIKAAKNLIVLDHSMTATIAKADYVLPAGSFAEADGTLINNEGRAQRFFQVFIPDAPLQEGWRWCADLNRAIGAPVRWHGMDDLIDAIEADCPQFTGIKDAAPSTSFRKSGMRFPRSPHRFSGRTALYANVDVREKRPETDVDSPLAYSMEGYHGSEQPPALMSYAWSPGWDSNQAAITRFQDEVGGHLKGGDPGTRLLKADTGVPDYAPAEPKLVQGWQAIPRYHIFGSESQSAKAPAIQERMPRAWFTVNEAAAKSLGLAAADTLRLTIDGEVHSLPITIDPSLPDRTIGVPVGAHGLMGVRLPAEVNP